jgi:hypothetical protein
VAVNPSGNGAIAFTITGPSMFPSAGYALLDDDGTGPIHIAGAGAAPEDGFTGYTAFGGDGNARWGDYSAAVAAPDGSIWVANEYITPRPRTVNANWGTFISRLKVKGSDDGHHGHDD